MHILPANFTFKIIIALILGAVFGLIISFAPIPETIETFLVDGIFDSGGMIFINLLKMLVVPVVFVSLVCGVSSLEKLDKLGRIGFKTFFLYLLTTLIALLIGLSIGYIFDIGHNANLALAQTFDHPSPPSFKEIIVDIVPSNIINAMALGNMLQLIVFAVLFGIAIIMAGEHGKKIKKLFEYLNTVIMRLVFIVLIVAPYGIFCILASLFAKQGLNVLFELLQYFVAVLFVLLVHLIVSYTLILKVFANLNPVIFFKKMYSAMLFGFSVSSSNASIPVVLETAEEKLGVDNSVASFVIPLGATINMDGTVIMQSLATVFIANAYNIDIGLSGYLTVILMATLASIGTAGVPSVGLITLTMVLKQVGLPVEGIALIIGVDRLLDMVRTLVNITGDAMIACVVAKSESLLNEDVFYAKDDKDL